MSSNPERVQAIFLSAVEKPLAERAAYLDRECGEDAELRQRVEALLRADDQPGSFLDSPPAGMDVTLHQSFTESPGTQIGPYKLLQRLGEGGMGVVYMAEQEEPVKRRVALKIIKPGMDSRQVIARFEAERQALAMMDHPNIAKVLDAGATESGRPYFVMELVNGLPVTKYCDEQQLTPQERLELFVPICQAVQHAHQKGIIHRDLKPSNILIALYDGQAVPKIIDFGVAKATSQTLTEKTMFTQLGQVVGTLDYMSPEQAERNQLDIDTRSDIYSLGVILYELLTGETPFDRQRLSSAAFEEMLRIIREEEPSKPSTKVSSSQSLPSIAAKRRMEPARLGSMIRGELDWIVMKAIEKERARRYETASKFAEDLQHYLEDEPVTACPPSATYRFKKLVRRNKALLTTVAAVSLALICGTIGTAWQAVVAKGDRDVAVAERQRARNAEQQAVAAEEIANRNLRKALAAVDQMLVRVGDKTLENLPHLEEVRYELLEDAVRLYDQLLEDEPNDARLQIETAVTERSKAKVLLLLGRREQAREPVERSIKLLDQQRIASQDSQKLQLELAQSHFLAGAITGELEPIEQATAMLNQPNFTETMDRDALLVSATTLNKCGMRFQELGQQARAEEVFCQAERLFEDLLARFEHDQRLYVAYAECLINFGVFYGQNGDWPAQESKLDRAIELCELLDTDRRIPEQLLVYATALLNRGNARFQQKTAPTLDQQSEAQLMHDQSDQDYQRSAELLLELVEDYPGVPLYRERLASALSMRMWLNQDNQALATRLSGESLDILQKLVADFPAIHEYRRSYGAALCNEANRLLQLNEPDLQRGEQLARKAIVQNIGSLEANPDDPRAMQYLANSYAILAEILVQRDNDPGEIVDVCSRGLKVSKQLDQRYPGNEFVAFVSRRLKEMKQAAERKPELSEESKAGETNVDSEESVSKSATSP